MSGQLNDEYERVLPMNDIFEKSRYYQALLTSILLVVSAAAQGEFIAGGVKLTPLTNDGKSIAVAWAYHGNKIAFLWQETDSQAQLMIMNSDGSGKEAVSPLGYPFFAEWSWKGDKLSYEFANKDMSGSQGGVYIYDVNAKRSFSVSAPYLRGAIDEDDGPFWSADDRYVAYKVRPGASRTRQLWVTDALSGKTRRILADRGECKDQRWSPFSPPKLSLLIKSAGTSFDVATVDPDGRNLTLLTDIGAQLIRNNNPHWSPTGQWIAFSSDIDMTQTERERGREDCWIARPDGTKARNLTNATSPATEEQLNIDDLRWSWDGRWVLMRGDIFDKQGTDIPTIYLADPVNGGYWPIMTSYPYKTGEFDRSRLWKWSYDSTKIAVVTFRSTVRNWGPDRQLEKPRWVLSIYDMRQKTVNDILILDGELDRKQILGGRGTIGNISWSPDNRSLVVTIATIVSSGEDIYQPDVYRLDLPARFIDASASKNIGPPMGRSATAARQPTEPSAAAASSSAVPAQAQPPQNGIVTELVKPMHMTVDEAIKSLSAAYGQYLTTNPSRNLIIFKGPTKLLKAFRGDLRMVDTPPPHILVDLMAVELSDEANRSLGLDWSYAGGHFGVFQPTGNPVQKFPHVTTDQDYRVGAPSGALDTLKSLAGTGQSFYQGVGTLPSEFFIRLNTLIKDGEGTILANPRTVATSGKESLIQIRKTLNYFFNEGFDVAGRPIVKKSDISADTEGRITPTLLADGKIHLMVDVKVGSFTFTTDAGLPELTTRESTTEVTVQEGETLVLGGLRQQEMTNSITKVPLLGDIPLIGGLFKKEETQTRHSVLTIFITPHVLRSDNAVPEWPQLNRKDYKPAPIMGQIPDAKGK